MIIPNLTQTNTTSYLIPPQTGQIQQDDNFVRDFGESILADLAGLGFTKRICPIKSLGKITKKDWINEAYSTIYLNGFYGKKYTFIIKDTTLLIRCRASKRDRHESIREYRGSRSLRSDKIDLAEPNFEEKLREVIYSSYKYYLTDKIIDMVFKKVKNPEKVAIATKNAFPDCKFTDLQNKIINIISKNVSQ